MGTTTAFDTFVTRVAENDLVIGRETLLVDHNTPPVYRVHARREIIRNIDVICDAEETERAVCDTDGLKTTDVVTDDAAGCADDILSDGMSCVIEVGI